MLFKTTGLSGSNYWLSFYRVEANGTETLILNEYIPGASFVSRLSLFEPVIIYFTAVKALNPRYLKWNGMTSSFTAEFSFDSTPDEMIFGTGQHQVSSPTLSCYSSQVFNVVCD